MATGAACASPSSTAASSSTIPTSPARWCASANFVGDPRDRGRDPRHRGRRHRRRARRQPHRHRRRRAARAAARACAPAGRSAPADTSCTTLSLASALHAAIDAARRSSTSAWRAPRPAARQLVDVALERGISVVAAADRSAAGRRLPGRACAASSPSSTRPSGAAPAGHGRRHRAPTFRRPCPARAGAWCRARRTRRRTSAACSR